MKSKITTLCLLSSLLLVSTSSYGWFIWAPSWVKQMRTEVEKLEKSFDGEFGVYIFDLKEEDAFAHRASEFWYLSSTIKVPVAVALLQLVEKKKIKLSEKVTITKADYRDGAGPVNWIEPGNKVSYKYLLKQMLIYSDNAATDLIIKRVGLDKVNNLVAEFAIKKEFGPITTLLGVRKKAYGELHPNAQNLSNVAFLRIKKKRGSKRRVNQLAKELKIKKEDFVEKDLTKGFNRYYAKKWNSATLVSYAQFLENIINNKMLNAKSTKYLLSLMSGIQTGKKRIRKGLSPRVFFAHKTGTQHKQACDLGVAGDRKTKVPEVLILVCVRNWKKLSQAEKLMAKIAKALTKTELL